MAHECAKGYTAQPVESGAARASQIRFRLNLWLSDFGNCGFSPGFEWYFDENGISLELTGIVSREPYAYARRFSSSR